MYIELSGEMTFKDVKSSLRSRVALRPFSLEADRRECDNGGRWA